MSKKRAIIAIMLILVTLCSCGAKKSVDSKSTVNPSNISISAFENDLKGFAIYL